MLKQHGFGRPAICWISFECLAPRILEAQKNGAKLKVGPDEVLLRTLQSGSAGASKELGNPWDLDFHLDDSTEYIIIYIYIYCNYIYNININYYYYTINHCTTISVQDMGRHGFILRGITFCRDFFGLFGFHYSESRLVVPQPVFRRTFGCCQTSEYGEARQDWGPLFIAM